MSRIALAFVLLFFLPGVSRAGPETELTLKLPPTSLAKWYKPANKRQVWLHTMFSLRREYQAVSEYILLEDAKRALKWAKRLDKHYRSIAEMVPGWRDELEIQLLEALLAALEKDKLDVAGEQARKLVKSCRSCHREYQAVVALMYRAPDFSKMTVEDSETLEEEAFDKVMERLTTLLNRVKIAFEDGRKAVARESLEALHRRLEDLAGGCEQCHRDDSASRLLFGKDYQRISAELAEGIAQADVAKTGGAMGELAVSVCARCHAIHRIQSDMRELITE